MSEVQRNSDLAHYKSDEMNHDQSGKSIIASLPKEQQQEVKRIAKEVSSVDHQAILKFGMEAQQELSNFSENMLKHVQKNDNTPVGQAIKTLMSRISEMKLDDIDNVNNGFAKMMAQLLGKKQKLYKKFKRVEGEIEKISDSLEGHRRLLMKDILMLDKYYEKNKSYYDSLTVYIAAAEYRLEEISKNDKRLLEQQVKNNENGMQVQKLNDLYDFINRLEKRINDLKLSRHLALQAAPQIRLIQQTNQSLVEKIQSSVLTTIPLWKNQVAIAITMNRQKVAIDAQKQVTDATNELLKRNSEMLKLNSIEAAKENERGVVNIETLKESQQNLLYTLEETLKIQKEGRDKRLQVEQTLIEMEQELKNYFIVTKR